MMIGVFLGIFIFAPKKRIPKNRIFFLGLVDCNLSGTLLSSLSLFELWTSISMALATFMLEGKELSALGSLIVNRYSYNS